MCCFCIGCARTEGYYKIIKDEKVVPMKTPDGSQTSSLPPQTLLDNTRTTGAQMSRELRSEHRRNLLALGDAEFADHFKFSQLKVSYRTSIHLLFPRTFFSCEKNVFVMRNPVFMHGVYSLVNTSHRKIW